MPSILAIIIVAAVAATAPARAESHSNVDEWRQSVDLFIEGTFAGPGVECPVFQLRDGRRVTLAGDLQDLKVGTAFRLSGRWARASACMQGKTFIVSSTEELKDTP